MIRVKEERKKGGSQMLWNIRKIWGIMLVFSLMILLAGCGTNTSGKEALTPTGYPSDEVQRITVY